MVALPSPQDSQAKIKELIEKAEKSGGKIDVTIEVNAKHKGISAEEASTKGICLVCVSTPLGNICLVPPGGSC